MESCDLTAKHCAPCRGGIPPMEADKVRELVQSTPGWTLSPNARRLSRQLTFEDLSVTMLTGSLGKYLGNYWYSARPFVQVNGDSVSASLVLAARRYFADADNFIGVRASAGSTPSDRMDPTELVRSSGWSAAVHGSRTVRPLLIGTWAAGVEEERLTSAVTRRRPVSSGRQ